MIASLLALVMPFCWTEIQRMTVLLLLNTDLTIVSVLLSSASLMKSQMMQSPDPQNITVKISSIELTVDCAIQLPEGITLNMAD